MVVNLVDVLISDDDEAWGRILSEFVHLRGRGFNPVYFKKPSEALAYLKGLSEEGRDLPAVYFVDMKPFPTFPERIDDNLYKERDFPEALFKYVACNGSTENFYFITAHVSQHDEVVLRRTGAKVIEKLSLREKIADALEALKS